MNIFSRFIYFYIYLTYKAKTFALFGSFCCGKKNNKKIGKLKKISILKNKFLILISSKYF